MTAFMYVIIQCYLLSFEDFQGRLQVGNFRTIQDKQDIDIMTASSNSLDNMIADEVLETQFESHRRDESMGL